MKKAHLTSYKSRIWLREKTAIGVRVGYLRPATDGAFVSEVFQAS